MHASVFDFLALNSPRNPPSEAEVVWARLAAATGTSWQPVGEARTPDEALDVIEWSARRLPEGLWILRYGDREWAAESGQAVGLPRPAAVLSARHRLLGAVETYDKALGWPDLWEVAGRSVLTRLAARFGSRARLLDAVLARLELVVPLLGAGDVPDRSRELIAAMRVWVDAGARFGGSKFERMVYLQGAFDFVFGLAPQEAVTAGAWFSGVVRPEVWAFRACREATRLMSPTNSNSLSRSVEVILDHVDRSLTAAKYPGVMLGDLPTYLFEEARASCALVRDRVPLDEVVRGVMRGMVQTEARRGRRLRQDV